MRFQHGISVKTGGALLASESFAKESDVESFANWVDALSPTNALDELHEAEWDESIPTLDQVAADRIRLLTGTEDGTRLLGKALLVEGRVSGAHPDDRQRVGAQRLGAAPHPGSRRSEVRRSP